MARRLKVFLDSDIFIRDLRFQRDSSYQDNRAFLNLIKQKKVSAYTSIYNLLEVCGYLSFNLDSNQLKNLYRGFSGIYSVNVLFPEMHSEAVLKLDIARIFSYIERKMALSDSLIAHVAELHKNLLNCFITWNAKHFVDKLAIEVLTPRQFFEQKIQT